VTLGFRPIVFTPRTVAVAVARRASATPLVRTALRAQRSVYARLRGHRFARTPCPARCGRVRRPPAINPLEAYFDAHIEGPGIWKWRHYFDVYDRHLEKVGVQGVVAVSGRIP